jgi:hypothetical protein
MTMKTWLITYPEKNLALRPDVTIASLALPAAPRSRQ